MKKIIKRLSGLKISKALMDEEELEELDEEIARQEEGAEYEEAEIESGEDEEDENDEEWLEDEFEEGQLSIDVYQTPKEIVVKSTIAGVKPDDIDISINNDMLTIRGKREMQDKIPGDQYLYRECYWGSFSRSIILPVEIEPDKIEASLENGVLTIVLPKAKSATEFSIKVKEKA